MVNIVYLNHKKIILLYSIVKTMESVIKKTKKVKEPMMDIEKSEKEPMMVTEKTMKGTSKWMTHVKAHRADNPDKSYKQSLIDAKASYVK
jgi:hypothetical protein